VCARQVGNVHVRSTYSSSCMSSSSSTWSFDRGVVVWVARLDDGPDQGARHGGDGGWGTAVGEGACLLRGRGPSTRRVLGSGPTPMTLVVAVVVDGMAVGREHVSQYQPASDAASVRLEHDDAVSPRRKGRRREPATKDSFKGEGPCSCPGA